MLNLFLSMFIRFAKVALVFLSVFHAATIKGQCDFFDVPLFIEAVKYPSPGEIENCLDRNEVLRDQAILISILEKFKAAKFREADSIFFDFSKNRKLSFSENYIYKVIYVYAYSLELKGENLLARSYYNYILSNYENGTALSLAAKIGIASISANYIRIQELKDAVKKFIVVDDKASAEDKIAVLLRMSHLLPFNEVYDLLSDFGYLISEAENERVAYMLYLGLEFYSAGNVERFELLKEYKFAKNEVSFEEGFGGSYAVQLEKYLAEANYSKALDQAEIAVKAVYGEFPDVASLLDSAKQKPWANKTVLFRYGQASLYQTRLGKGLEPVKNAFEVFSGTSELAYSTKLRNLDGVASWKQSSVVLEYVNVLIVGVYLYQKTGDIDYLNRSVKVLDGVNDSGGLYWAVLRELMRDENSWIGFLSEKEKEEKKLLDLSQGETIEDLISKHIELLKFRKTNQSKSNALIDSVENKLLIHLPTLQSQQGADSSAVLSYYLSPSVLYRLFVSGDTIMIDPINAVREEALVLAEEFKTLVQGPRSEALANTSHRLFELLFSGLEDLLPERVHIIASGALTDVPFSALRMDAGTDRPRYLGVEHAVSRQFSIRGMQLLEQADLRPTYERPLALAPAFKSEWMLASELRQAGFVLPPLTHNSEELEALEAFGPGRYLYGARATRERYREYAPDHSIIHLATHALSSDLDGLRSRVYLLGEGGEAAPLYASEVGEKTLNADLVVLSACETGGGARHVVEGTIGLTKAYLAAGARAVVASSWAVDDLATARLMEFFYGELAGGARPHDALRSARASFLEANPDVAPQKWAAFEAYGGMKAPRWDKSAPAFGKPWWWAFGLAGLALVLYWLWNGRKRTGVSDAAG